MLDLQAIEILAGSNLNTEFIVTNPRSNLNGLPKMYSYWRSKSGPSSIAEIARRRRRGDATLIQYWPQLGSWQFLLEKPARGLHKAMMGCSANDVNVRCFSGQGNPDAEDCGSTRG